MNKIFLVLATISLTFSFSELCLAKGRRPPKAYSYFDDNGKATQGVCDPESKIPKKLLKQKDFSKARDYLGSEKLDSELKSDLISWKHYFRNSSACNQQLLKVQTAAH